VQPSVPPPPSAADLAAATANRYTQSTDRVGAGRPAYVERFSRAADWVQNFSRQGSLLDNQSVDWEEESRHPVRLFARALWESTGELTGEIIAGFIRAPEQFYDAWDGTDRHGNPLGWGTRVGHGVQAGLTMFGVAKFAAAGMSAADSAGAAAIGALRTSAGDSVSFFSVQGPADATRLMNGGVPWPTGVSKSLLGEGFYAWGSRSQDEAYLAVLEGRGATGLTILEARIGAADYAALRSIDLRTLGTDALDAWMETHSL
jgi:hypothetical protein